MHPNIEDSRRVVGRQVATASTVITHVRTNSYVLVRITSLSVRERDRPQSRSLQTQMQGKHRQHNCYDVDYACLFALCSQNSVHAHVDFAVTNVI